MFGITQWDIIGWVVFGSIGIIVCAWAKMKDLWQPWILGFALMIYPYFVGNGIWLWIIGILLTGLVPFARD